MSERDRQLAERVEMLRADGLSWMQVSEKLRINVDRCKRVFFEVRAEVAKKTAVNINAMRRVSRPDTCANLVRREGEWERRCEGGLGECACLKKRGF